MAKIHVLNQEIAFYSLKEEDYISLTDIARYKNQDRTDDLIRNWLRNRNTLEFLGIWEYLNNPDFNPVEFDGIKMQAGLNSFTLTPKQWIEKAILLVRKQKIMIDTDLATLYGIEPRVLVQAVKRNLERFPEDFMFQLNKEEADFLTSQIVTLKKGRGQQ